MKTTGTRKLTMKKLAKTKRTKFHKTVFSNTPLDVGERMWNAFGNEEIFWQWFKNRRQESQLTEWEALPPAQILDQAFTWSQSPEGFEFWHSLYETLKKEELLCRQ